jgi:ketosteroid isomerase-like protein
MSLDSLRAFFSRAGLHTADREDGALIVFRKATAVGDLLMAKDAVIVQQDGDSWIAIMPGEGLGTRTIRGSLEDMHDLFASSQTPLNGSANGNGKEPMAPSTLVGQD